MRMDQDNLDIGRITGNPVTSVDGEKRSTSSAGSRVREDGTQGLILSTNTYTGDDIIRNLGDAMGSGNTIEPRIQ